MYKFIPLLLIFFIFSTEAYGQKDYLEGYVVLNTGDTLSGLIKDRKGGFSPKLLDRIIFKGAKRKQKYGPGALQAYYRNGWTYESVSFTRGNDLLGFSRIRMGQKQFLKVYISDYLSLYQSEYIDNDNNSSDGNFYLIRDDEVKFTFISLLNFKSKMEDYLSDAEELSLAVTNREYKYKDLLQLVTDYNNWYWQQKDL